MHHTRKNGTQGVAAGQSLRGSGDLHAFGDSNLYLRRTPRGLLLSSEHRAAPAAPSVYLELVTADPERIHLQIVSDGEAEDELHGSLEQQVLQRLSEQTLTRTKLRELLSIKNQRLGEILSALEQAGKIRHTPTGWQQVN